MAPSHRVRFCLFVCFFFAFFFFTLRRQNEGVCNVPILMAFPLLKYTLRRHRVGRASTAASRASPASSADPQLQLRFIRFCFVFFFQKGTHFFDAESADRRVKSGRKLPRRVIYSPTSTSSLGRSAILICYSTAAPSTTLDPS